MNWYYNKEGISQGPHSEAELEAQVRAKAILPSCLVWHTGLEDWQPISTLRPAWVEEPKPSPAPAKPEAAKPAPAPPPAAAPPKPSFLKRLFGFGKK